MIHIHIVTYNSAAFIEKCIRTVFQSQNFQPGETLFLSVSDNASTDGTVQLLHDLAAKCSGMSCVMNSQNLGFCAGQNQGATLFMKSPANYFLALNPDIALRPDTLSTLIEALEENQEYEAATPLLLQSDRELQPFVPERIDAAGMILNTSLRHFDRYSGELLQTKKLKREKVFGGTGACLLLKRSFVEKVSFRLKDHDSDMFKIYPQLQEGAGERVQLFDEAFFAYRDDADLALRAGRFGAGYLFVPEAIAYHKRLVLPENRSELPEFINALGVKNRFLLQLTNLSPLVYRRALWKGFFLRNLLVIFGVLLQERTSLRALREVFLLWRRARERYHYIEQHSTCTQSECVHMMEEHVD